MCESCVLFCVCGWMGVQNGRGSILGGNAQEEKQNFGIEIGRRKQRVEIGKDTKGEKHKKKKSGEKGEEFFFTGRVRMTEQKCGLSSEKKKK